MRIFGEQFGLGVLRDPVSAILGGVSAGTNLIGGIFGASAAKSAAATQAQAAATAGQTVTNAAEAAKTPELVSAQQASDRASAVAGTGATAATSTAAAGGTAITNAGAQAGAGAEEAGTEANQGLSPYAGAGATAANVENEGVAVGGEFNKTPGLADLQIDPGYAFREQQGEEALNRNAAATGGLGSGGYLKDLTGYSQGQASQEYQNAFSRYETAQQNKFQDVNAVANAGQAAATTQGGNTIGTSEYAGTQAVGTTENAANLNENAQQFGANLNTNAAEYGGDKIVGAADLTGNQTIDAAKTAGDYLTQGANATAAGKVAATNAITGGVSGAANTALTTSLFSRPSQNYFNTPPNITLTSGGVPLGQGPDYTNRISS